MNYDSLCHYVQNEMGNSQVSSPASTNILFVSNRVGVAHKGLACHCLGLVERGLQMSINMKWSLVFSLQP